MIFYLITENLGHTLVEVLTAVIPVLLFFIIFIFYFKMPKKTLVTLLKGIILAFSGLVLFLQGVKIGFMPVGLEVGSLLAGDTTRWVLIPLGFILGFVSTLAEPAVRILSNQVEKSSSGYIRSSVILFTLCLAVGIFIALGMTRIVLGIPLYFIILPGYLLAIILMFFSRPSFTAIAFDSGGVATGPMTVTFIMALAVGAAGAIEGRNAIIDGFGLIALVALAPIILVMLLGFLYPEENDDNDNEDFDDRNDQSAGSESDPKVPDTLTNCEED